MRQKEGIWNERVEMAKGNDQLNTFVFASGTKRADYCFSKSQKWSLNEGGTGAVVKILLIYPSKKKNTLS